jgi:hypothetical protein
VGADSPTRHHAGPAIVCCRSFQICRASACTFGELLGARPVKLPLGPIRAAVAAAWSLHLVPASPTLVDLALSLPVMDTARARAAPEWKPSWTSLEAIREFLTGPRETSGDAYASTRASGWRTSPGNGTGNGRRAARDAIAGYRRSLPPRPPSGANVEPGSSPAMRNEHLCLDLRVLDHQVPDVSGRP